MPIINPRKQFRQFIFTLHQNLDYQKISGPNLLDRISALPYFRYVIFSLESTKSNKPHYQGYVQLNAPKRISEISPDFLGASFDYPNGTFNDNKKYCTKLFAEKDPDGNYTLGRSVKFPDLDCGPWEAGDPVLTTKKGRPSRSKSDSEIVKLIQQKASLSDIILQQPEAYRNVRQINETKRILHPTLELSTPPEVYWFSGVSGSGKTTYAEWYIYDHCQHDPAQVYRTAAATKTNPASWFEEAASDMNVLFLEEVRLGYPETYDFMKILDGVSPLSVKGSLVRSQFKFIYITAIDTPEKTYQNLSLYKDRYQVMRRIDYLFYVIENSKLLQELKNKFETKLSRSEWRNLYRPLVFNDTSHHRQLLTDLNLKICPPEYLIALKATRYCRELKLPNCDRRLLSVLKSDIEKWYLSHDRDHILHYGVNPKRDLIDNQCVFNAERTEIANKKVPPGSDPEGDDPNSGPQYWTSPDDFDHFSLTDIVPYHILHPYEPVSYFESLVLLTEAFQNVAFDLFIKAYVMRILVMIPYICSCSPNFAWDDAEDYQYVKLTSSYYFKNFKKLKELSRRQWDPSLRLKINGSWFVFSYCDSCFHDLNDFETNCHSAFEFEIESEDLEDC